MQRKTSLIKERNPHRLSVTASTEQQNLCDLIDEPSSGGKLNEINLLKTEGYILPSSRFVRVR
jgi:hypothetical protein